MYLLSSDYVFFICVCFFVVVVCCLFCVVATFQTICTFIVPVLTIINVIDGVIVNMLNLSEVNRGFKPTPDQT